MNESQVKEVLSTILYPGFQKDIVTFGFVKNIEINGTAVIIDLEITSSAEEVEQMLKGEIGFKLKEAGATELTINIKKPNEPRETSSKGRNLAPQIKNFVMVSSGKGGVGKSTTTVNLAVALAMQGKKVGILDADIYGPNIPRMLGAVGAKPEVKGQSVLPIEAYGIEMISMASLMEEGQSLIWRGSMIMKVIEQLLQDISWGELDVLVIDMPPGTGDAQLTLAQSVPVTAGLTVTTPQKVSLDDSRRSLDMFSKLHIPIAGVVENMSGFICPETNKEYDIFGKGTSEVVAKEYSTEILAQVPIEPAIREGGDEGKPITYHHPESQTAKNYMLLASNLWAFIEKVNEDGLASNEAIQPTSGASACSTAAAPQQAPQGGGCGTHGGSGQGGCGCGH